MFGRVMPQPPPGTPQPAQAEPEPPSPDLSEQQTLVAWEFLMCLDMGFSPEQSLALVSVRHFTWHDADTLLKRGWPLATVVDELT